MSDKKYTYGFVLTGNSASAKRAMNEVRASLRTFNKTSQDTNVQLRKIKTNTKQATDTLERFRKVMAPITTATIVTYMVERLGRLAYEAEAAAESVDLLRKRLDFITKDNTALRQTIDMAYELGVSMSELGGTVARFSVATKGAFSTDEILEWQRAIILSGKAVGLSSQEAAAGVRQVSQALSKGKLDGDEMRSVLENFPILAQEFHKYAEKSGESIYDMGAKGKITQEVMIGVFEKVGERMNGIVGLTDTLQSNTYRLTDQWDIFLNKMADGATPISSAFAAIAEQLKSINDEADMLTSSTDGIVAWGEQWGYVFDSIDESMSQLLSDIGTGFLELSTILAEHSFDFFIQSMQDLPINFKTAIEVMIGEYLKFKIEIDSGAEILWESLSNGWSNLGTVIAGVWQEVRLNIAEVIDSIINSVADRLENIGKGLENVFGFDEMSKSMSNAAKSMRGFAKETEKVEAKIQKLIDTQIKENAVSDNKIKKIKELAAAQKKAIQEGIDDALEENRVKKESRDLDEEMNDLLDEYIQDEHDLADAHKKTTKAIKEKNEAIAGTCERVRKALACEDKLLFEYDAIAKATYEREQAIKDLDHALANSFMTTEVYIESQKKINEEFKKATEGTKELEKQTTKSTKSMTSDWEKLNENIQSLFINTVVDMFTETEVKFDDLLKTMAKMWLNTTLNMAFSPNLSGGGGGGGNLTGTQIGSGSITTNFMTDIAGKMFNGGSDFTIFASGNDFSFAELKDVLAGTNGVQIAGSSGEFATFDTAPFESLGANGTSSAGFSAGAINGAATFGGGLVANQIGGWEGVVAGGITSVGSMALMGTLSAMGPVGWAALAVSLIMGSGVLEGNSDITPDLNVGGTLGGTGKGATIPNMGAEDNGTFDPAFGYDGTFGSIWASTQHDAFDSEEAAQQFIAGITAQFAAMDNSIANALGYEMTKVVSDAMGNIDLGELKGEESEDWTSTLEQHYRTVFGNAMSNAAEATGDEDWGIWDTLSGDMQSVVYVTTEYVKSTGELKSLYEEMLDIHNKNANIISEQMGNWNAVNNVFEMLGVNLYDISLSGVDAANALVEAAGGLVELANLTGYFYETFYSAQEKGAHYTKMYADSVTDLNEQYNTHISTSTAAYKHWTLEILNNADASEELKVAMLALAPVTAQVIQAEQAATQEREAYLAVLEREIAAMRAFNVTIDDLLLGFTDNPALSRAESNLQGSLNAFGIDKDASSFTEDDLKNWLEYLDTVELTGEAATLAATRATSLYNNWHTLNGIQTDIADTANDAADALSGSLLDSLFDFTDAVMQASMSINDIISSSTEQWMLDTYTDAQKHDYYSAMSNADYASLQSATSPEQIESLVGSIMSYGDKMWGLLDDDGKSTNLQGYLDAAMDVDAAADLRMQTLVDGFDTTPIAEAARDSKTAADTIKLAADAIKLASDAINTAAGISLTAAQTDKNVNVTVELESSEVGFA